MLRADAIEGCPENSEEAGELAMIAEALEAYECKRWPDGKVPDGKVGLSTIIVSDAPNAK